MIKINYTLIIVLACYILFIGSSAITLWQYKLAVTFRNIILCYMIILFFVYMLYHIRLKGIPRKTILYLLGYIFLVIYAIVASIYYEGFNLYAEVSSIWFNILFSIYIVFVYLQYFYSKTPPVLDTILLLFGCLWLIFILSFGGLENYFPPRFNFQTIDGDLTHYTQGFTKFCSFLGFAMICIGLNQRRNVNFLIGACILVLAFFGGARGDFAAGLICIFCILCVRRRWKILFFFVLATYLAIYLLFQNFTPDEIVMLRRFLVLTDGNFGGRDNLLGLAFSMLGNGDCNYLGCGFAYFQHVNMTNLPYYPHNSGVEALLVFGLPIGLCMLVLSIIGFIFSFTKCWYNSLPICWLQLEFVISFKSGSVLGYLELPALYLFTILGFGVVYRTIKNAEQRLYIPR